MNICKTKLFQNKKDNRSRDHEKERIKMAGEKFEVNQNIYITYT